MERVYKEPINEELETTVNVLYSENCLSIYTNKPDLQKKLYKVLGEPSKVHMKGKKIYSSNWVISLDNKSQISKMILKANLFEI